MSEEVGQVILWRLINDESVIVKDLHLGDTLFGKPPQFIEDILDELSLVRNHQFK